MQDTDEALIDQNGSGPPEEVGKSDADRAKEKEREMEETGEELPG